MKYIIVRDSKEGAAAGGAGFDQWGQIPGAQVLSTSMLEHVCSDADIEVIHFLFDETRAQDIIRTASSVRETLPAAFLILSLENPLREVNSKTFSSVFGCFDLLLCSNDDIYHICKKYAPRECMIKTETSPVDIDYYQKQIKEGTKEPLFTIVANGYSWGSLIIDFGIGFIKQLYKRYKIRIVPGSLPDRSLISIIQSSCYVLVPRPLYDGGRVASICALSRTLLIAHPSLEGAQRLFPYTILDPENLRLTKHMLRWLLSSGYEGAFSDNAYYSVLNLNHVNKGVQLRNLIQYKKDLYPAPVKDDRKSTVRSGLCIAAEILHIKGEEYVNYRQNEFAVVCLLKDGEEHLPAFLDHYRRLGCSHFIFVDNGSVDNTLDILHKQPDVTLYSTSLPHKYFEVEIRRIIAEKHCRNHWCLWVDIDELFDYPFSDTLDMCGLLEYLNRHRYNALVAHMLDMYQSDPQYMSRGSWLRLTEEYPCYDVSGIKRKPYFDQTNVAYNRNNSLSNMDICCYWGGIRKQVFPEIAHDNILTKHPLIFLDGTLDPITNAHFSDKARVADITGVLYHYKFVPSFAEKVKKSHTERNYVKFAQNEYDAYYSYLQHKSSFIINTPGTRKLKHVNELLENNFLVITPAFHEFMNSKLRKEAVATPAGISL